MARARTYPDTPAGRARQLRDSEDGYLGRLGHQVTWRRGHGKRWLKDVPGYTGQCALCGGTVRVAPTGDGTAYCGYEGAMAKKLMSGPRRCARGR
jgi:hypothetical protein